MSRPGEDLTLFGRFRIPRTFVLYLVGVLAAVCALWSFSGCASSADKVPPEAAIILAEEMLSLHKGILRRDESTPLDRGEWRHSARLSLQGWELQVKMLKGEK